MGTPASEYNQPKNNEEQPCSLWSRMTPADLIALTVIIGGLILISLHIDGIIGGLLVSVVAYYFGAQKRPPTAGA